MFNEQARGVIKKGEAVTVKYDPDMPENAMVVEALSKYIDPKPVLAV